MSMKAHCVITGEVAFSNHCVIPGERDAKRRAREGNPGGCSTRLQQHFFILLNDHMNVETWVPFPHIARTRAMLAGDDAVVVA